MVFVFVAGPLGVFGTGGRVQNASEARGTMAVFAALTALTLMFGGSFPYAISLLSVFANFFPDVFDRVRTWLSQNLLVVGGLFFLAFLLVQPDEAPSIERQQDETRRTEWSQRRSSSASSHGGRERSMSVDGFDGSWSGSVIIDFGLTMLFMMVVLFLPQIWSYLNRMLLRVLPEEGQVRWRRWTEFLRPASPSPGSIPTSREALAKLEDVVLEERHLLMESSPGGITCPVCLENMKVGDRVKRLPCKHLFHPTCVLPWLEKHNSCPSCRFELETSDPVYEAERRERQREQERMERERAERQREETARREQEREERERRETAQARRGGRGARFAQRTWNAFTSLGSPFTRSGREQRQQQQQQQQQQASDPQQRREPSPTTRAFNNFSRTMSRDAETQRLMALSVVELKSIARQRHVNVIGCVEKRELVERIVNGGL